MGQCPVVSPVPGNADEHSKSAALPFYKRSCHPFVLSITEWSLSVGYRNSVQPSFLKLHKQDRSQKCILEPREVHKAFEIQTQDMLIRDGFETDHQEESKYYSSDDGECSLFEETSTITAGMGSEFAMSEITTWTSATHRVINQDKYAARSKRHEQKFQVMENINENGGKKGTFETRIRDNERSRKGHHNPAFDVGEKVPRRVPFDTNELRHASSSMVTNYLQPKAEIKTTEEAYTAVLHLRLRAKLADFYVNSFLPMFPNSPIPPGLSRYLKHKPHEVPNLTSEDSDDHVSQSSHSIGSGSIPPSSPIKFLALNTVFMELALTGSLGLEPRSQHHRSPGRRGDRKSPSHYIVLMNRRSGIPLAVCALKADVGPPVVRIFSTKQRVFGQRPAASTGKLGLHWSHDLPLYSWAEIVTEGDLPNPLYFSIFMASGSDGKFTANPNYRAVFLPNESTDLKVVGRTDRERHDTGCAIISLETSPDECDLFYHLSVAQGIDPALMMCFAAVFDEVMERAMRARCRSNGREARPARYHGTQAVEYVMR